MFQSTTRRLYQLIGKTKLTDLPLEWQGPVSQVLAEEETADPNFKNVEIRGSRPNPSHDDPSDKEDVISVRLKDADNKTMRRLHIHQDGSVKKLEVS
ncbi:hypothetical protein IFM53868_09675 [Aspergillus udagawae]|uniref:Uncharacterized protein n=1 Tax=Aspergillus udagawae TaxID=91492 RepID=A0ABQ1BC57_9EURO|nr:hypothetical protein IFM53868_09675 [Aspergillus udagawae]